MKIRWTKDKCQIEALKYNSRIDFKKNNENAYQASRRNNWLDDVCYHMNTKKTKPKGYWNYDRCQKEALKYKTRNEFQKENSSSYTISYRNKWLDKICSHMNTKEVKPPNHWNKDNCGEEAKKYIYKSDFIKNNTSAYQSSIKNEWIDEICAHMKQKESIISRYIYSFEFDDGYVYVGLSYNPLKRKKEHLKCEKSKVFKHNKKCSNYKFIILTEEPVSESIASKLERKHTINYKNNNWKILNNMSQLGNLGTAKLYWTKERCKKEALIHITKAEFRKNSYSAYQSSYRNGWLNEIFPI